MSDEPFLWQMLYHAVYTPPGEPPPPLDITQRPELSRYVAGWGAPGDLGVVAEVEGQPAGAAWLRRLTGERRGYGHVDDQTAELTIAVLPGFRNQGIGDQLLTHLLAQAAHHYPAVSLSVLAPNPARRLYERHGFTVVADHGGLLTMLRHFADPSLRQRSTDETGFGSDAAESA